MDGDDYTWEEGSGQWAVDSDQLSVGGGQMGEAHVQAMERVVGLWPYPTVVAVGVLAEVLGFVRRAAAGSDQQTVVSGHYNWDWREEFKPLPDDECYDCDQ